ncbi:PREDICTED: rRNA methyltransferase 1, mitochondrial [Tinamus guttatus]|uniref:rRNA methyltransferase 1, mitochondrial n=1 Tax=Tinamus guttatus TaxID=94827 RepID=UPI00052EBEBF|nr:PREDICTED: rRNA methyltransferase 1, mitochondrial [Tinamus guttatus]
MEVFDVYSTDNFQGFLKAKTAAGWEVVGTVSSAEATEDVPVINCLEFQWSKPIILVIGNEGDGMSLETQRLCHRMLIVPPGRALCPGIESLNVSVATGILLHSICSQRPKCSDRFCCARRCEPSGLELLTKAALQDREVQLPGPPPMLQAVGETLELGTVLESCST